MATEIGCICLLAISMMPAICHGKDQDKNPPRIEYTAIQNLKNYALSVCLANGLETKEARIEASDAAGAYLELGSFGIDAYNEVATLARKFLTIKYMGMNGEKLTVMKCIDFSHSKELDQLAQKYN